MNGTTSNRCMAQRRAGRMVIGACALLAVTACDLSVVNPGSMVDTDLDNPVTIPAIVNGVVSDYGRALAGLPQTAWAWGLIGSGAVLTDELVGSTLSAGVRGLSDGESESHWPEANQRWAYAARARWVANRALERLSQMIPDTDTSPDAAVVSLYGGWSNRILGDHFCHAVRDVGPLEPHTVYYDEAEQHFTRAIAIAEAALAAGDTTGARELEPMDYVLTAAYGGRAQIRMQLGRWDDAAADAARVATEFVHWSRYSQLGVTHNVLWAMARADGASTVWGTPFMEWGIDTTQPVAQLSGDIRITWQPAPPTTPPAPDNRRPRVWQTKHTNPNNPIANMRGTEMRLIEGEAALLRGDWQVAIEKINDVRAFRNQTITQPNLRLEPVSADNEQEAWHLLMRERGIEMWLEGRRLPDLRRWEQTPGPAMVPFTVVRRAAGTPDPADDERVSVYAASRMCLQIGENEVLTNPNLGG